MKAWLSRHQCVLINLTFTLAFLALYSATWSLYFKGQVNGCIAIGLMGACVAYIHICYNSSYDDLREQE